MELAWNTQKNQLIDVKGKEMEQERKGKITNEDIDLDRTKNNIELVDSEKTLYQRVKSRVDDLKENGSRVQKNSVVMYSNILTVPEEQFKSWGEKKTDEYFKTCYEFFCDEFGKENVVSAKIHKDESTPHMHLHFVPANKENGKLQARVSMNKAKINYIHDELPVFLRERGFEVVRASGKTKDKNIEDIHEFKMVKKQLVEKENELEKLDQRIDYKRVLLEKVPSDSLKINSKKEIQVEQVKVGLFAKENRERETGNVIISLEEFEKMKEIANAARSIKEDYEYLVSVDVVEVNDELLDRNARLVNENNRLRSENSLYKKEIGVLKAHVSDLKAEVLNLYKSTKEFLKDHTSDFKAFKTVFKTFVDTLKEKGRSNEFERLERRERDRENENELER